MVQKLMQLASECCFRFFVLLSLAQHNECDYIFQEYKRNILLGEIQKIITSDNVHCSMSGEVLGSPIIQHMNLFLINTYNNDCSTLSVFDFNELTSPPVRGVYSQYM